MFPHENPVYTSDIPHTCYMLRPSHPSRLPMTMFTGQNKLLAGSICYQRSGGRVGST
jgi:hypothetical protein